MAKSLVFANGRMHVGLNEHGLVSDLYYPYVGLENHISPECWPHKIGVYVDGRVSWLDDSSWNHEISYHDQTMVSNIVATNEELGLRLELTDAVDVGYDVWLRDIHVVNLCGDERELKLYHHQAFTIGQALTSDTAQYRPDLAAVMHYKGNRVFLASLVAAGEGFDEFSIGKFDMATGSSTFHDADDGRLEGNAVENGRVDSVMGVEMRLEPFGSRRVAYYLAAGQSVAEAESALVSIKAQPLHENLKNIEEYWSSWLKKAAVAPNLSDVYRKALDTSLLVIKAHIDERGAVMASLDGSLRNHPEDDTYNFCWGRDATYILWPLVRLGYTEEFLSFMDFTRRTLSEEGYLEHKYLADGSLGSTWLPYEHLDGTVHAPIQADETALTLFLAGQYFKQTGNRQFLSEYYNNTLVPMAEFLARFIGDDGLPLPSYDPWEHDYLTHTYTTALTSAALKEAADLADSFGRDDQKKTWTEISENMKQQRDIFYNANKQYFYRGFLRQSDGKQFDETIDVLGLYGSFMFGYFDTNSEEVRSSLATIKKVLQHDSGYSRFERDDYFQQEGHPNVWAHITLWLAQIAIELDDVDEAEKLIETVLRMRTASGMLPEQVNPDSTNPTSVTPLVWAHAELVSTLIDYMQAERS